MGIERTPRRLLPLFLPLCLLMSGVAGCTGGDTDGGGADVAARMAIAKNNLDDAASIDLSLSTDTLPDGVDGITDATGVATHEPAFEGTITISAEGLFDGQTVEVVAVDGRVYAQTPFASSFIQVDPADFGAPDPATLMATDVGLSTLLSKATDLEETSESRAGRVVLTSVTGSVPGRTVAGLFPSASATSPFEATFWLDGDDSLRRAQLSGAFYTDAPEVTYDITVEASDEQVEITEP